MQSYLSQFPKLADFQGLANLTTVLFDLDDTLIDSEKLHALSFIQLFAKEWNTRQESDFYQIEKACTGQTDVFVFRYLIDHGFIPAQSIDRLQKLKNQKLEEIIDQKAIFESEMKSLLEQLSQRYTLGIVTSSERSTAQFVWDKFEFSSFFKILVTREDTEKNKPDPMPYLYAMEQLGATPESTLIFEDSEVGLTAAKASGAQAIQVAWF